MPMLTTYPITEVFGASAGSPYIQLPIPVASQIGITDGAASFTDAFPPLTFVNPTTGGTPPRGVDFNGITYMLSQYAVGLQQGLLCGYNAAVSTEIGGYPLGALLASADGTTFWFNTTAGNTSDPDTGGAGWLSFQPPSSAYISAAPAAGANNDYDAGGALNASVSTLDLNPPADCSLTGIAAGDNNQEILITNVSAFRVTLDALNAGSAAANRLRLAAGGTILTQYNATRIRYLTAVNLWVQA